MTKKTKILLIIICMVVLMSSNVFAQIFQRQIFMGLHGNATKLIGGEVDDSTVRVLGEFNGGYYITRKIGVGIEGGYGFEGLHPVFGGLDDLAPGIRLDCLGEHLSHKRRIIHHKDTYDFIHGLRSPICTPAYPTATLGPTSLDLAGLSAFILT